MRKRFLLTVAILCTTAASAHAVSVAPPATAPAAAPMAEKPQALTPEQSQFFEAKVRPILTQNCYKCHSLEAGKAKGQLVLDSREGWQKGGELGPVIVPGDPAGSKLVIAVAYSDPDLQMPPKEKLSDQQIADLTAWVKMGAPDPRSAGSGGSKLTGLNDKARAHWAYQPVKPQAVPEVQDQAWVRNPIDAFVLAKLEQNGMKPNHIASREALIRRATYDLIGLPPTPQEVQAFVNDRSPNAFEKVVDRLLASPHYGERWGRFWLDTARYSDTTGAEQVRRDDYRYPYAWTYRDYVIKSFNDDKPYDQFLQEQIAADQLPDADKNPESLAALGFITVGKRFQNPNDTIDERIDTLCKATMALTVSCARCHDHKFDPIPQADYYSLHGVFTSTIEPADLPLIGKSPAGKDRDDFEAKLAELEAKNRDIYYEMVDSAGSEFRKKASAYLQAFLSNRKSDAAAMIERNKLISQNNLDRAVFVGLRNVRKEDGVFAPLVRFRQIPPDQFSQQAKDVLDMISQGGGPRRPLNPLIVAAFKDVSPDSLHSMNDVAEIYGKLFAGIDAQAKEYVKAMQAAKDKTPVTGFDPALVSLIEIPAPIEPAYAITTDHLRELLPKLPAPNNNSYARFQFAAINELELTHPGSPARAMVVADSPTPKDSPVFIRGEANNRGPIAPREFLQILSGPNRERFKIGSGRLELARAVANKDNPLTARVLVNRVWMHHFGDGFVRTPDDLGVQSEPPSHPELLDYLARQFVEEGNWSIKKLHREIMLSNAYQQSSDTNPVYAQKDPENRLLWRANLRRLDFEAIRDTMLVFTGKLDETMGGKPVNLTDEPYSNRRSVYGYIDRGRLPELMSQFDFGDPDRANSRRTSTIVPQQALFLMNSPMSADVARKVTTRPEFLAAHDDAARVKALYEVLYQRQPKAVEIHLAADFFNAHARPNGQPPTAKLMSDRTDPRRPRAAPRPDKAAGMRRNDAKRAIQNEGETVERKPLSIWEEYAQALLFTNEIAYVN
jgi:Protein of unknown function (DUF1553)/Protein of unknown function (DUF1549)/Planctomycete cytochrome C